jgi:CubicO group peptidase (beta-lactamase class C family)
VQKAIAQTTYPAEVQKRILAVENGLFGRIIFNGKADHIMDRMKHYNVKGLSIAVVNDYKIEWAKGYGFADVKEGRKVGPNTLFEPGSISKSLNALGALKLVQENKIQLDKDINTYLKSWQFPYDSVSKGKKITLANLLSHTAGLNVHGFMGYDRTGKLPSLTDILDGKAPSQSPAIRSSSEPNVAFEYSGGGTTISQLLIEDVSSQPYHVFMQQYVLTPLGMTNSFFNQPPPVDKLSQLATGYDAEGNEIKGKFHVYPTQAAAGLWTTPTDLAKYMIDVQLSLKGQSNKVLNKDFTELHTNRYLSDADITMGSFKQERNGEAYFFHDAGNDGFRGLYFGSLEGGNGIVVVVNSDVGDIIYELMNSVANVYNWKGFDKPKVVNTVNITKAQEQAYVGTYIYEGKIADVSKKQDGLYYWTDGSEGKMHFTSSTNFINVEFPSKKSFLLDSKGKVIGFGREMGGKKYPPATKLKLIDSLNVSAEEINAFGWHLLETKRFAAAVNYLSRGSALWPNDSYLKIRLAHGYLFGNEAQKAIDLYKKAILQAGKEAGDVKLSITDNFEQFAKLGLNTALIAQARKALDL